MIRTLNVIPNNNLDSIAFSDIQDNFIIWWSDYKKKQLIRIQSWYRGVCGKKVAAAMRIERAAMLKMANLCAELITGKKGEEMWFD